MEAVPLPGPMELCIFSALLTPIIAIICAAVYFTIVHGRSANKITNNKMATNNIPAEAAPDVRNTPFDHVRLVAILNIVQGVLESAMGAMSFIVGLSFIVSAPKDDALVVLSFMFAQGFIAGGVGVLRIFAGYLNYQKKSRQLGIQGNCMLNRGKSGPNLFEDVLVPAGAESFAADVVFDRSVAL